MVRGWGLGAPSLTLLPLPRAKAKTRGGWRSASSQVFHNGQQAERNSPPAPSPQQKAVILLPKFQGPEITQECGELHWCWAMRCTCCRSDVTARCGSTSIQFHISVLCMKRPLVPLGRGGACPLCHLLVSPRLRQQPD